MKDVHDAISRNIRSLTQEWLDAGTVPTMRAIGDGLCEEFAEEALARIAAGMPEASRAIYLRYTDDWWMRELDGKGVDMDAALCFEADIPRLRSEGAPLPADLSDHDLSGLIGAATHVWLEWNGLHFDATAPEGRPHFLLMPFFADQIEGYRRDPARPAA
jgi:hypothetical protein